MRLIDADALVRDLEVGYCDDKCDRNLDCVHGRDCPIYDETTHIYEADTVEAVPIKPLANWLAGYAFPPELKVREIVNNRGRDIHEIAAEGWESFLRGMDWEGADE